MYKFVIDIDLQPGTRDLILERAPEVQSATRAESGCIAYDFFVCTDDPDRLVFVESWTDPTAHELHMEQEHTKEFIAFHEQFHRAPLKFTVIPQNRTCYEDRSSSLVVGDECPNCVTFAL